MYFKEIFLFGGFMSILVLREDFRVWPVPNLVVTLTPRLWTIFSQSLHISASRHVFESREGTAIQRALEANYCSLHKL